MIEGKQKKRDEEKRVRLKTSGGDAGEIVVVVVVFYCPYAQSINCGEDISVETDECRHISVINIDVETP